MNIDNSYILYQKYFSLKNQQMEIKLKNLEVLKGTFIGFYRGNDGYISKWHFVETNAILGTDTFGFLTGRIIEQKALLQIKFIEDNTILNF